MTVSEMVFNALCKDYKEDYGCDPPQDIWIAFFKGACLADTTYRLGCEKKRKGSKARKERKGEGSSKMQIIDFICGVYRSGLESGCRIAEEMENTN